MSTTITEPDTQLDWTDQVRTVARFISDHDLEVISVTATSRPEEAGPNVATHIRIHVFTVAQWDTWRAHLEGPYGTRENLRDGYLHQYATGHLRGMDFPVEITTCQTVA